MHSYMLAAIITSFGKYYYTWKIEILTISTSIYWQILLYKDN